MLVYLFIVPSMSCCRLVQTSPINITRMETTAVEAACEKNGDHITSLKRQLGLKESFQPGDEDCLRVELAARLSKVVTLREEMLLLQERLNIQLFPAPAGQYSSQSHMVEYFYASSATLCMVSKPKP